MSQAVVTTFKNSLLNDIGGQLIQNYKGYHENAKLAREYAGKAIVRRFLSGKLLSENHDQIIEEMGSQRAFGEQLGISESMLSNDKRAFEAAAERGADTPEKLLDLLQQKNLKSNVWEWERLPKLLNEPDSYREPDRRDKDEKRLEQIYGELDEIKGRHVGDSLAEEAKHIQQEIIDTTQQILLQNPTNMEWESEHYLQFVRTYGRDILTGETLPPDVPAHPHHVDPFTGNAGGGVANKIPDCFTIPLHPDNHQAIHDETVKYTTREYQKAIITVATKYIILYG